MLTKKEQKRIIDQKYNAKKLGLSLDDYIQRVTAKKENLLQTDRAERKRVWARNYYAAHHAKPRPVREKPTASEIQLNRKAKNLRYAAHEKGMTLEAYVQSVAAKKELWAQTDRAERKRLYMQDYNKRTVHNPRQNKKAEPQSNDEKHRTKLQIILNKRGSRDRQISIDLNSKRAGARTRAMNELKEIENKQHREACPTESAVKHLRRRGIMVCRMSVWGGSRDLFCVAQQKNLSADQVHSRAIRSGFQPQEMGK
jgi:hypothetical protein